MPLKADMFNTKYTWCAKGPSSGEITCGWIILWMLSPCQPSPRTSEMGLARINNFGRGKARGEKKKERKEMA